MAPLPENDVMGKREVCIGVVFSFLAIAAVAGRIWARRIRNSELQLSDLLIVIALVFTLGLNATIIAAVFTGGAGQHMTALSQPEGVSLGKVGLCTSARRCLSFVEYTLLIVAGISRCRCTLGAGDRFCEAIHTGFLHVHIPQCHV